MANIQRQLLEILPDMLDTFENLVLILYEKTTYDRKYLTRKVKE